MVWLRLFMSLIPRGIMQSASFLHEVRRVARRRFIMKVSNVDVTRKPTKEQIEMLNKVAGRPVTFDEDARELTEEELAKFKRVSEERRNERRKQIVTLRVSPATLAKAKSLGTGYSGVLSRMLDMCLNDPELIKKCL